jgi:hypothetical protein
MAGVSSPRSTEPNNARRRIPWRVAKSRSTASALSRFVSAMWIIMPRVIHAIDGDRILLTVTRLLSGFQIPVRAPLAEVGTAHSGIAS